MKKRFTSVVSLVLITAMGLFSQVLNKPFTYQGYAVDLKGVALNSEDIVLKITIGGELGDYSHEFVELHSPVTTDAYGIFNILIGGGTKESGVNFDALHFDAINYTLKIEVKLLGEDDATYTILYNDKMHAVPYARHADNGVPIGSIQIWAGARFDLPDGYLLCDGASLSNTGEYKALFDAIGYAWGGVGTDFNLPDLRGMFIRGVDGDRGIDPDKDTRTASNTDGNTGNAVGSLQTDSFKSHDHTASCATNGNHAHPYGDYYWHDSGDTDNYGTPSGDGSGQRKEAPRTTASSGSHNHTVTIGNKGGNETRPDNVYVNYIIKAY